RTAFDFQNVLWLVKTLKFHFHFFMKALIWNSNRNWGVTTWIAFLSFSKCFMGMEIPSVVIFNGFKLEGVKVKWLFRLSLFCFRFYFSTHVFPLKLEGRDTASPPYGLRYIATIHIVIELPCCEVNDVIICSHNS